MNDTCVIQNTQNCDIFMNTPNKIFWISHVFKLCVYLLPFMITDNQNSAIPHPHQLANCEIILHIYSFSKDTSAKQPHLLLRRQNSKEIVLFVHNLVLEYK